MILTSN